MARRGPVCVPPRGVRGGVVKWVVYGLGGCWEGGVGPLLCARRRVGVWSGGQCAVLVFGMRWGWWFVWVGRGMRAGGGRLGGAAGGWVYGGVGVW